MVRKEASEVGKNRINLRLSQLIIRGIPNRKERTIIAPTTAVIFLSIVVGGLVIARSFPVDEYIHPSHSPF